MKPKTPHPIATARSEAERLTASIRERLETITGSFFEVGELLRLVQDGKLFGALGYKSMRDYMEGELRIAATQAYAMIRIVRNFARADAEKVGLARAHGLIRYAAVVGDVDPGELVRQDARIGDTTVSEATLRDIDLAIADLRAKRRRGRRKSPREVLEAKQAAAMEKHLRTVMQRSALGRLRVEFTDDDVVLRFSRNALARRLGL